MYIFEWIITPLVAHIKVDFDDFVDAHSFCHTYLNEF